MENINLNNQEENTETITPSQEESKEQGEAVLSEMEPVKTAGRPTKYDPKFNDMVDDYLNQRVDKEVEVLREIQNPDGEVIEIKATPRYKVQLPTVDGFARFLNINRDTMYTWAKEYPEFSDTLEKIKVQQKERLIDSGLSGDYNSTIAKLILSSNHNMSDKTDMTSGGEPIKTVSEVVWRVVKGEKDDGNSPLK